MYSSRIKTEIEKMFTALRLNTNTIVSEVGVTNEAVNRIIALVSSETSIRSKTILSDMLFDLNDELFETDFFSDIARQNRFMEMNLRQEILSKYQFKVNVALDYQEASRAIQAIKVGGSVLIIGGVAEIGVVLIAGLSLTSLVPIPISVLVAVALGAALTDYLAVEPRRSKEKFAQAVDQYLVLTQQQFINWFDEVEKYYSKRVDEIKQTL